MTSSAERSGTSRKSRRAIAVLGKIVFAPASVWPVWIPQIVQVGPKICSLTRVCPFIARTQPPIRNSRFRPISSSSIAFRTSESSSLIGAICDENPSIVITPFGEVIVARAWTRRHAGLGTIVPHFECRSERAPNARSSRNVMPLNPRLTTGFSRVSLEPSSHKQPFACKSSGFSLVKR